MPSARRVNGRVRHPPVGPRILKRMHRKACCASTAGILTFQTLISSRRRRRGHPRRGKIKGGIDVETALLRRLGDSAFAGLRGAGRRGRDPEGYRRDGVARSTASSPSTLPNPMRSRRKSSAPISTIGCCAMRPRIRRNWSAASPRAGRFHPTPKPSSSSFARTRSSRAALRSRPTTWHGPCSGSCCSTRRPPSCSPSSAGARTTSRTSCRLPILAPSLSRSPRISRPRSC